MGETIIEHIAHLTKVDPVKVRLANMDDKVWRPMMEKIVGDIGNTDVIISYWQSSLTNLPSNSDYYERKKAANIFNEANRWRKRGIGFTQIKYPLDYFGVIPAYVAIYYGDGSVIVSHGGAECGQGINTKVAQIAAYTLGIPLDLVKVKATDNQIGANSFWTAASTASDSACLATKKACELLLERIKPIRDQLPKSASWQEIVQACHEKFVDLTAKTQFVPGVDGELYYIYGCCCAEVEWDALTGNLQVLRVDLVEDTGRSISPLVDVGQVEGAFTMGLGYWLNEKYVYDPNTGKDKKVCFENKINLMHNNNFR